jgi:WD40 repeat protein
MSRKLRILLLLGVLLLVLCGLSLYIFLPFTSQCTLMAAEFFTLDWSPKVNVIAARGISGLFFYSDTLENITPRNVFGVFSPGTRVGWSPNGSSIAIDSGDSSIFIRDAKTFKLLGEMVDTYPNELLYYSWSPDGSEIAGYNEKKVSVWSTSTFKLLGNFSGHTDFVESASWSPDSRLVVSSGLDGMIYIWNASSQQKVMSIGTPARFSLLIVKWSPVNPYLIASGDGEGIVRVWNTLTGTVYRSLDSHSSPFWISSLAWSHDGKRIALTSDRLQIWDVASGQRLFELENPDGLVNAAAWSPDDRKLVSAGNDGTIRMWDTTTGKLLDIQQVPGNPSPVCPY